MAHLRPCQGLLERLQLRLPPHKGCQAPRGRGLQAPAHSTGAHQLKHLDGLLQALHRHWPQGSDLHQALSQTPDDTDTLIGLGTLALARHQFQDALDWGSQAIASNDYKSAAYGVAADAYTELGRYNDAVDALQKMVDLRPDQTS